MILLIKTSCVKVHLPEFMKAQLMRKLWTWDPGIDRGSSVATCGTRRSRMLRKSLMVSRIEMHWPVLKLSRSLIRKMLIRILIAFILRRIWIWYKKLIKIEETNKIIQEMLIRVEWTFMTNQVMDMKMSRQHQGTGHNSRGPGIPYSRRICCRNCMRRHSSRQQWSIAWAKGSLLRHSMMKEAPFRSRCLTHKLRCTRTQLIVICLERCREECRITITSTFQHQILLT